MTPPPTTAVMVNPLTSSPPPPPTAQPMPSHRLPDAKCQRWWFEGRGYTPGAHFFRSYFVSVSPWVGAC